MKKKIFSVVLVLLMALSLIPTVGAQGQYVRDEAKILTAQQQETLESSAQKMSEKYGCNVYIHIIPEYLSQGDSLEPLSKDYYRSQNLGYGEGKDGIMLTISMSERKFWLLGYGDFANEAMTDHGRKVMIDKFVDNFKKDDWFGGFEDYLEQAEFYLKTASKGNPYDVDYKGTGAVVKAYGIGLAAAMLIAAIICGTFLSQMKTAKQKVSATVYVPTDGLDITRRVDNFTHTTTTRVKVQKESSSGGGGGSSGGGTSVGRDGFSGSGGSF